MVQIKHQFQTFEEYLSYDDGTDKLYELFNGELIEMPPELGTNVQIANRLFLIFALLIGTDRVRGHGLELEVRGEPRNRYPDLIILSVGVNDTARLRHPTGKNVTDFHRFQEDINNLLLMGDLCNVA